MGAELWPGRMAKPAIASDMGSLAPVLSRGLLLGFFACAWTVAFGATAQSDAKTSRVAFLANGSPANSPTVDAFRRALQDLGHTEGQTLTLDIRWAEGRFERLPELAADLVRGNPDVVVTAGPMALLAARRATSTIPIVMIACDPAETIVERIARPSGHITGVTCMSSDLTPKRLQLLKEAVPHISRVAVLYNPFDPHKAEEVLQMRTAAGTLGLTLQPVQAGEADAFEKALTDAVQERPDALFVLPDPLTLMARKQIAELAARFRLPAMYGFSEFVETGGLMSYGTIQNDLFRRAAAHVDKVLRGAKPADVPVEQAILFELVVNMKAAEGLGLTFPPSIMRRADRVIE